MRKTPRHPLTRWGSHTCINPQTYGYASSSAGCTQRKLPVCRARTLTCYSAGEIMHHLSIHGRHPWNTTKAKSRKDLSDIIILDAHLATPSRIACDISKHSTSPTNRSPPSPLQSLVQIFSIRKLRGVTSLPFLQPSSHITTRKCQQK